MIPCTCSKIPHIHFKGNVTTYTVVTATKVIQVPSYEEGREVMQTISGSSFLYYHCKPIKGIISDKGNLMHLQNNPPTPEEVFNKSKGYTGYLSMYKAGKYVLKAANGYVVVDAEVNPIKVFKTDSQLATYWRYAN
jgi:hypothetical protein